MSSIRPDLFCKEVLPRYLRRDTFRLQIAEGKRLVRATRGDYIQRVGGKFLRMSPLDANNSHVTGI